MPSELTVFIVDDDPAVRDALGLLLGVRGYRTAVFDSGERFLQAWRPDWSGALLIDIRMSGMDGLTLQKTLAEIKCPLPVIIITGHGDVALAREAFKARAIDFLEKPLDHAKLLAAIEEAFSQAQSTLDNVRRHESATRLIESLTARELEVMKLVVSGKHNREIAPLLGISVRTVEVHKARVMAKLGVSNVADLLRIGMLNRLVQ